MRIKERKKADNRGKKRKEGYEKKGIMIEDEGEMNDEKRKVKKGKRSE